MTGPRFTSSRGVREPPADSSASGGGSARSKLLLTVEEAAGLLSIGRTRVFALIRTGQLASVRVGSSRRVTPEALEQYVKALHGVRDTERPRPATSRRSHAAATGGLGERPEVLVLPFDDRGDGSVTGA
jgi:excisionase family DNA binding protein